MKFFTTLLSALALAASTTTATPITERGALLAVAPTITSPAGGEVWQVGSWQTVAWDTLDIPAEALNYTAEIFLGFSDGETPSENLFSNPMAQGFRLEDGSVSVYVPKVPTRNTYFVVLVGDSGDKSGVFTILDTY